VPLLCLPHTKQNPDPPHGVRYRGSGHLRGSPPRTSPHWSNHLLLSPWVPRQEQARHRKLTLSVNPGLADNPCQPFSKKEVCSICSQPYNPDAAQLSPDQFMMHFCPRDKCQTACHRDCLSSHPIKRRPTCSDRKLSLLCSIPSTLLDSPASPSLLSLLSKSKPKPTPQFQSKTRKRKRGSEADAVSLYGDLPPDLIELASQPIVRPTFEPEPPKRHRGKVKAAEPLNIVKNVAGNVTVVLKARVLINDVLMGSATLPRDWRKKLGWDDAAAPTNIVDSDENGPCPPLLCPTCGEHI